jgi:flavin reductase (DIM6/NTAB) family NADH-FMN oxidoreductase RutF
MKKKAFPLARVYQLIEPGPLVLVSTSKGGRDNVMAMSWHTMMEFEPPLIGCVVSDRNYSFNMLKSTKECVINIPTIEMAATAVKTGNTSGRDIDKFEKFGLTKLPAARVKAPLIGECYANLECKVINTKLVNEYGFFILEVVKAWINPANKHPKMIHHHGMGSFTADGRTFKLSSKMK